MLALLRAVGARPFQNETFAAAEWRENLLGRHGQSRDGCERLAKQNTIYLEFLNVTHRRLISAFRPPAPDMDSTRTEARSPKGARASASHGSSAQTPARPETSARLLLAARDIAQVVLNRGGAFLLKEQRRARATSTAAALPTPQAFLALLAQGGMIPVKGVGCGGC